MISWSDIPIGGPQLAAALRITLILLVAWVAVRVLRRGLRTLRARLAERAANLEEAKRAETLARAFRYIANVVIVAVAVMLVLGELGVSLAPILGAAGVVGLAVGFGAQSLVKDYFTGFFMLFEDQLRQGDVVQVAGIGGLVEEVTLRYVRLRDYDGNVHFIPNSLITTVTNRSKEYAQSVIDVGIAYRESIDEALDVMREVARELRADPVFAPKIYEDLDVAGVERWDNSAVVLRARFKVAPIEQWNVRREYLRRLKYAFDERGIEIPYPHITVYAGVGKDGSAPPFPVALGRLRNVQAAAGAPDGSGTAHHEARAAQR
ncbi:MAG TPA: mechanosensitive ion channel family protein [Burkholderiaceae bacterium]|nr:mechanosensitive ion channel family protein [Burkholderiaceae bacterium]